MSPINLLLYVILWIYIHSPVYLINEFIDGLQITRDPDTYLKPPQIITRYGYPAETHHIQTPDGFILELHRIPHGIRQGAGNQYPILLIHGYLDSSSAWIALKPENGLAYLLADQGYDVWMINTRGNTFSQSHANYTPMERDFWDFSFHEMGVFDLPTTVDFVLKKTNHRQLFCVGDSAGNSVLYIMLSLLPKYNEKITALVSLAPVYHTAPSILNKILIPIVNYALRYLYWNTPGSLLEHDLQTKILIQISTMVQIFGYNLYEFFLSIIYGLHPDHINQKIMPSVYSTFPAGTSIKATLHLLQLTGPLNYFDYGYEENLKIYGSNTPPEYNISNVFVPVRIYHTLLDIAASSKDVSILYDKLPIKAGLVNIHDFGFTHLDFMWNKNAKELLYNDVIAFLNGVLATNIT